MATRIRCTIPVTFLLTAFLSSCELGPSEPDTTFSTEPSYARFANLPEAPVFVSPAEAATDPNPYFPLVPDAVWTYRAETEDGEETTVDAITGYTRMIGDVEATVLRDEVYLEGELIELTFDWHAQDREGNVWYLGEAACEWEPGEYVEGDEFEEDCGEAGDPAGSWEAGVDGAEAGVIMWADPDGHRGKSYRQEYFADEAEDFAKVVHTDLEVAVAAGTFVPCVETMDRTLLEPGAVEHKFYCAGYGLVLELQPRGGRGRSELVAYEGLPVG